MDIKVTFFTDANQGKALLGGYFYDVKLILHSNKMRKRQVLKLDYPAEQKG